MNRVLTPANQTALVSKSARVSISTEQSEQTLKCLETDTSKWELFQQSTVDLFRQFSCSEEMKLTTCGEFLNAKEQKGCESSISRRAVCWCTKRNSDYLRCKPFLESPMGLPISRSIIESHGDRLWATPNTGPRATFQFVLPIEPSARQTL